MTNYFSTPVAIALTLLAAAMWGSWMQVIKLKKDYPITGIAFMLYMFSFLLVWALGAVAGAAAQRIYGGPGAV